MDAKPRELYLLFRAYDGYENSQLKVTSKNGKTTSVISETFFSCCSSGLGAATPSSFFVAGIVNTRPEFWLMSRVCIRLNEDDGHLIVWRETHAPPQLFTGDNTCF